METKRAAFLTVACFTLSHPLLTFAQQVQQPASPQYPPWEWSGPGHMWGGGWGFWWIFPLMMMFMIIVGIAIFFVAYRSGGAHRHWGPWHMMDRASGPGRPWGDPTYSALQILNERFAKGEIQKQEYEEKKAAILAGRQH